MQMLLVDADTLEVPNSIKALTNPSFLTTQIVDDDSIGILLLAEFGLTSKR